MQTLDEGDDASTKPARSCPPLTQQTPLGCSLRWQIRAASRITPRAHAARVSGLRCYLARTVLLVLGHCACPPHRPLVPAAQRAAHVTLQLISSIREMGHGSQTGALMQVDLAAIVASSAAVISIVNLVVTTYSTGRRERFKWARDSLAEAFYSFIDASFLCTSAINNTSASSRTGVWPRRLR
jgi:hypothetical protein